MGSRKSSHALQGINGSSLENDGIELEDNKEVNSPATPNSQITKLQKEFGDCKEIPISEIPISERERSFNKRIEREFNKSSSSHSTQVQGTQNESEEDDIDDDALMGNSLSLKAEQLRNISSIMGLESCLLRDTDANLVNLSLSSHGHNACTSNGPNNGPTNVGVSMTTPNYSVHTVTAEMDSHAPLNLDCARHQSPHQDMQNLGAGIVEGESSSLHNRRMHSHVVGEDNSYSKVLNSVKVYGPGFPQQSTGSRPRVDF